MTHAHDELQAVKPTREEQEPANELVTEICDRIYRMQLPVSMPGLGHVNCYALEDNDGFSLVDPGLPSEESWACLLYTSPSPRDGLLSRMPSSA